MKILAGAVAAALCATGADAATISVWLQGAAGQGGDYGIPNDTYFHKVDDSDDTFVGFDDSAVTSGPAGSAEAEGAASANSITGEIKAGGWVGRTGPSNGGAVSGSDSIVTIAETFSLSGTGVFIANMLVDAVWAGAGSWWASVMIDSPSYRDVQNHIVDMYETPPNGVTDLPLAASVAVSDLDRYELTVFWKIFANVGALPGPGESDTSFVDIMNTGTIFFSTTGTLTATPSSPTFLSDAAYPDDVAPVPLPAAGWLLALGLAGLGMSRLRRA